MGDEFIVFAPKTTSKKYNVMRFSAGDKADIKKWTKASLSRDLTAKKQYDDDFDFPEFGEGSEFGKRRREEARRLKYGKKKSHFVVENQPWDLTISTLEVPMDGKKNIKQEKDVKPKVVSKDFHGKKEGGIGEGSMYFVFTQRPNHSFEAYPVQDWCNFSRKISHRTLTDEEAEAAWDKRDKILNHLNYMARKRLHIEDAADNEEAGPSDGKAVAGSSKAPNNPSELQIHDHEEDVGFISNSDDEDNEKGKSSKKTTKKPKAKPKKKKQEELSDSEVEGKEDSDDGENEGAEIAYDTDVSSENEEVEDERIAPKGLDELTESSSSEDEEGKEEQAQKDQAAATIKVKDEPASSAESDMDDIDGNESYAKSALLQAKKGGKKDADKDKSVRSNAPTADKKGSSAVKSVAAKIKIEANTAVRQSPVATGRKESQAQKRPAESTPSKNDAKRQKIYNNGSAASSSKDAAASSTSAITAEAVRRILTHKPITIPKLLKKFRSKSDLNKDEICDHITKILRTMKLHKIKINDKMHLYLKN